MSAQETGMIDIPALFVESFISFANDINDVELGDDVIGDLEFEVSEDGRRLYLANKCPGFYPYLQLESEVGGLTAHPNRGCRSWGLKPPVSSRLRAM